ncbi:peptidase M6 [Streptomyces sp. Y2F8-2]|nr:peptidase M6 [Streptomyces sp. Y2F8-2]
MEFREPHPEVDVPRPLPLTGLTRETLKGLARGASPVLRSSTALATSMTALVATSLVTGPALVEPLAAACQIARSRAHHSEGVDTWNAAYTRPTRALDAVLVFLSFPDATPATTPAELTGDYFPDTSRFFERASYGRFTLRPHPVDHWIRMPHPSTSYAIRRDWSIESRAIYLRDALAAADKDVDFSRYDIVYLMADPDAPGVDSDATKVVNLDSPLRADGRDIRRVVTVFEKHPPDQLVLAHETGHVFDLPDLYHRPTDGKGDWDTYVGDWDLMGSQFGLAPDLFAWHKWKLGWLDESQVVCVRAPGSTRLTLEPVAAGPTGVPQVPVSAGAAGALARGVEAFGSGHGTKLAVVRTGPDSVLAIEARGAVGNDSAACTQGVLVYRVRGETESGGGPVEVLDGHPHSSACAGTSVYPPLADAPVREGETFTVPGEGVRVEVEGRTASGGWTVRITKG